MKVNSGLASGKNYPIDNLGYKFLGCYDLLSKSENLFNFLQ